MEFRRCCILLAVLITVKCIASIDAAKPCECFFELVDILRGKGIIENNEFTIPCQKEVQCLEDPLTPSRISEMKLLKSIPGIVKPVDILLDGNTVLVASRKNNAVIRYDEKGNEIARHKVSSEPRFLAFHDNKLYVTAEGPNQVLISNDIREDKELSFTEFLSLDYKPNAIRFTPDGKEFIIGSYLYKMYVYDSKTNEVVREIPTEDKHSRFIEFSADGDTIYVTHASNKLSIYSAKNDELLDILTFGSSDERIDGLVLQCDGSKILVGATKNAGKLFFIDENDELIDTFVNPEIDYVNLRDIAETSIGTVFLTDHDGQHVYVFQ